MSEITTNGLELAKNVFQVHGVNEAGEAVLRKRLRRGQMLTFFAGLSPCVIGMEACATAHYWARELRALGRLMCLATKLVSHRRSAGSRSPRAVVTKAFNSANPMNSASL